MKYIILTLLFVLYSATELHANVDSLLQVLDQQKDPQQRVELYLSIAKEMHQQDLEQAMFWVKKAETSAFIHKLEEGKYKSLKLKSELWMDMNAPDSAINLLHYILHEKLAKTALDSADIYNQMGVTLQSKGDIEAAMEQLNVALKLYHQENSKAGLAIIMINMGNCFYEAGKAQEAMNYFKDAYDIALEIKDKEKLPIALLNYSMLILYLEQDTEKVDQLLKKLKQSSFIQDNQDLLSAFHQNLAVFYTQVEDWKEAENNYKMALEYALTSGYKIDAGIYSGLGQVYLHEKNYTEAIIQYQLARQHAKKLSEQRLIYNDLAQLYAALNNIDSAQHYWELTYQTMRAQEEENAQALVLKSKNNLELVKKENEIQLLDAARNSEQLKKRINLVIIIGLIILLAFSIQIAYLILQRKKKEIILKDKELELKKQKLTSLSLRINQKNQVLKDFETTVSEKEEEHSKLANDAKKALKNSLRIDEDWEEFELFFNDLHSGFYDELKKRFPNLSNNELKICTLSKLRFSLKEIAQTLFLSVDSVKSARYRIRKKLNMEKGEDLSDFLNNLNI